MPTALAQAVSLRAISNDTVATAFFGRVSQLLRCDLPGLPDPLPSWTVAATEKIGAVAGITRFFNSNRFDWMNLFRFDGTSL
jgi:hypothetical protein